MSNLVWRAISMSFYQHCFGEANRVVLGVLPLRFGELTTTLYEVEQACLMGGEL